MAKVMVIPDVQAKPGVSFEHLKHIGEYWLEKKPEIVVCLGDFADMPSLSSYDRGKKSFEGRRYKEDIKAAKVAMDSLLKPIRDYNAQKKKNKEKQYKPRMVLVLGNHEHRISRAVENQPELEGVIGYHDLPYQDWEVHDFLKPVFVEGICFTHFLANPMSGKPFSGNALNQLIKVGTSFVVGHKQTLDIATRYKLDGTQQWGIICGACYTHQEDYKGYQGNDHFRGILMLHRVKQGNMDPCIISLDYLAEKYNSLK